MKKYRVKMMLEDGCTIPGYYVQVRTWPYVWVTVQRFYDPYDPDFARREAEELLDKLNEK